jgi:hypothetical protein
MKSSLRKRHPVPRLRKKDFLATFPVLGRIYLLGVGGCLGEERKV